MLWRNKSYPKKTWCENVSKVAEKKTEMEEELFSLDSAATATRDEVAAHRHLQTQFVELKL